MTSEWKHISLPLSEEIIQELRSGDQVYLSGILYTARDKAHARLCAMIDAGESLPFDISGQVLYYVGPSPKPPGEIIGAAGPTTSYRMDPFTEKVLKAGIKGMIGKGKRGTETRELLKQYGAVYFSSFGGAGAYLNRRITGSEVVAFEDLGPEAIYRLEVKDFPAIVINDIQGSDLYENAVKQHIHL